MNRQWQTTLSYGSKQGFPLSEELKGALYDPMLGRMLSPDSLVQSHGNLQSYNRYSYCLNNPLRYTDPSGWTSSTSAEEEEEKVKKEIARLYAEHYGRQFGADGLTNEQWMSLGGEGYNSPLYNTYVDGNRAGYIAQMQSISNIRVNVWEISPFIEGPNPEGLIAGPGITGAYKPKKVDVHSADALDNLVEWFKFINKENSNDYYTIYDVIDVNTIKPGDKSTSFGKYKIDFGNGTLFSMSDPFKIHQNEAIINYVWDYPQPAIGTYSIYLGGKMCGSCNYPASLISIETCNKNIYDDYKRKIFGK